MSRRFRRAGLAQGVALLFILSLAGSSMAMNTDSARLIPQGKVHIYDGGQKIGELSSEAPLPEGKILTSKSRFGVKLQGMYLVAEENARCAVTPLAGETDLFVETGRVLFALTNVEEGGLSLSTPQDTVTVQGTLVNASTETSTLRGYLAFENNQMEIGVIDGGKLVVANARGRQVIESGNALQVQNVQAALGAGGAAGAGGLGVGGTLGAIVAGAVVVGVGAYAVNEAGDDDDPPSSGGGGTITTSPFIP